MSNDPSQDYFSDGLTEVLTSDLSRISSMFVISRNSAFSYKGKPMKAQEVSQELGVRYVLEGSVQKAGEQVRIVAQLIDAPQDHHVWTQRYDRSLTDLFALQDEIVRKIVTTLKLQLTLWEQGYLVRKRTDNLEAYDSFLRGIEAYWRTTKAANVQARQLLERAVALDPQYAEAYSLLAWTYWMEWSLQWSQDPQALEQAFTLAQKARALDDALPSAYQLLGYIYLWKDQPEQAFAAAERAITVSPNEDSSYVVLGAIQMQTGRPEEAIKSIETAMRLNPRYPPFYDGFLGGAYRLAGRYEDAIRAEKKALARAPDFLLAHLLLAATYSELGREEEARAAAAEVLRLNPNFSLEVWRQRSLQRDPARQEQLLAALRKAGLK